ncbi:odontogenesis associated phosphoprotein isoform X2 [Molossus molossus]|uniref:odontogenesis associated phosphoprotein isoform X2 n=1 Tax=Molossus molossus TaxID=27622 RepID=UPI001747B1D0|nr:odontogenesis associated phosphoprotein isoform X2 [Molossus molossus]
MAHRHCFSYWLLACWLVVTVAEGQRVVTPPGGSQNNVDPTDCQIFTLTPPPATRNPVTRIQPSTRTPHYFPRRRFRRGSSSEETRVKREAPNLLRQRKLTPQKRL